MSLWGKIVAKLREMVSTMISGRSIEKELNITSAISTINNLVFIS